MSTKSEKARLSFNYACKQASKCRHEKYTVSCESCSEKPTCDIQERIELARKNLRYEDYSSYFA